MQENSIKELEIAQEPEILSPQILEVLQSSQKPNDVPRAALDDEFSDPDDFQDCMKEVAAAPEPIHMPSTIQLRDRSNLKACQI